MENMVQILINGLNSYNFLIFLITLIPYAVAISCIIYIVKAVVTLLGSISDLLNVKARATLEDIKITRKEFEVRWIKERESENGDF